MDSVSGLRLISPHTSPAARPFVDLKWEPNCADDAGVQEHQQRNWGLIC